jgi:di/tricarboxylate transporter
MLLTFLILAITVLLFVFSRLRADLVALLSLLALFLAGIITADQALAGFSNSTVILVAALFVVGEGLSRTGVTAWLGQQLLKQAGNSELRLLVVLLVGTALLSAFISNTGTVAMLLPAVVAAAWRIGSLPSKFLIPLAFAANLGGLLTLIGTPPNIVVSDTLANAGLEPFSFFEFSLIGIPLLAAALVTIILLGQRLLPARESGDRPVDLVESVGELADSYHLQGKLFQLRVRYSSSLVGKTLAEAALGRDYGVSVLRIEHPLGRASPILSPLERRRQQVADQLERLQDEEHLMPGPQTVIQAQDLLVVKGNPQAVERVMLDFNIGLQELPVEDADLAGLLLSHEVGIAEVLLTPRSEYIGRTIYESQLGDKFNVQVITLRRSDKVIPRQGSRLDFGDSLLVRGDWEAIERLRNEPRNFVVVGSPEAMAREVVELSSEAVVAVLALVGMVAMMITGVLPTVMAALIAGIVMILGGCLTVDGAYRAISWQTVILIAAMLPMSTALEVTGGAEAIAAGLVSTLGRLDPWLLLAGIFLLTAALSQVISNTATTILVAPIVLQAAQTLSISPQPLLMMVAVGASAAFLTPIASPVNTLVFTPGGYAFKDYVKLGLPLLLVVLLISLLLVPIIWPL